MPVEETSQHQSWTDHTSSPADDGNEAPRDQPSLSLPKAGGAIRGLGEKFSTNPATGTASLSVPIALTESRTSATPELALSYDSGAGNGPFGLGWEMGIPSISRRTDKGVPQYLDDDVFQLTGAEDLVPAPPRSEGAFTVTTYRPRTEGLFSRIERWHDRTSGETHWRVTSKQNITSVFGRGPSSRISDPADPSRVFRWLVDETVDDHGNVVSYEYKADDANRYLKRVRYGNRAPGDFCFEVVLDYGEHDASPAEARPWQDRLDPFSTRRPGFEVRTRRLCRRVLMFHHFPELGSEPVLVAATTLGYRPDPAITMLTSVTRRGFTSTKDKALPALRFDYTDRIVAAAAAPLTAAPGDPLPQLDGTGRWVDLDGEGIAGILAEQGGSWYYRANLGNGRLAGPRPVDPLPAGANLSRGRQLMDLAGDGRQSLTDLGGSTPGFHRRTEDRGWAGFTTFRSLPSLAWADPNLRFVDLTGDGLADVLLTGTEGFTWHPSAGLDGFGPSVRIPAAATEERGPRLVFADAEQSVYLADMTGDGLTDLVRVRNGDVCYWPSLGHGRFGAKVTMAGAPVFDHPDRFDQARVRLSDVDGSAPADLLYLGPDGVRMWFNQAGNSYSDATVIDIAVPATASVADVLGKGTACLVTAEPRPDGEHQLRYIDLMADGKPHLMSSMDNGMGLRVTIRYESSTTYYLADEAAGKPWFTRLPFPVHAVSEVTTRDEVADTTLVSTYRYRHGYYDGVEREFRGFAYVEHRDAQSVAGPEDRLYQPPAVTRRWQHTGWYTERDRISRQFEDEYWPHDEQLLLPDTVLPSGLTTDEEREAVRTLRGQVLREEVYAEDRDGKLGKPYVVTETNYQLRLVQPRGQAPNCVVFSCPNETVRRHTERVDTNPRITHVMTLDVDEWGNIRRSVHVSYGLQNPVEPAQATTYVSLTESSFTNDVGATGPWRVGLPKETHEYEVGGLRQDKAVFSSVEMVAGLIDARRDEIPFHEELSRQSPQRRLIARSQQTYYTNDMSGELPLDDVGVPAMPYRAYRQVFADGQVAKLYGDRVTDDMLSQAGYLRRNGLWWAPSDRKVFDPQRFFLPVAQIDPLGSTWHIGYDEHIQQPVRVTDPGGNVVQASLNYRVMRPWLLTDANGNRTGARFDPLGLVVATAVMGKGEGDTLDLSTVEESAADRPTTRLEYDLAQSPVRHRKLARETHRDQATKWHETWTYADGTGRTVLTKTRAEPAAGQTTPRWTGTGRTIYDNKGNPVKQYEPYFAATSDFDTEAELVQRGVSVVLYYDPLGRLIRTEYPDGTDSRVEFTPWEQRDSDRNDTVLDSQWYATRIAMPPTSPEHIAALATKPHAGTSGHTHLDTLGRAHVLIADNGSEKFRTTIERDVQGNERAVVDARNIRVVERRFDMLGRAAYTRSPDAGERWSLLDAREKPVRGWDSRNIAMRWRHDELLRPTHTFADDRLRLRYYYGDQLGNGAERNLNTLPYAVFDGAGVTRTAEADFKGNVLTGERRFAKDARNEPDWSVLADVTDPDEALRLAGPLLETTVHRTRTEFDALNRPTLMTSPDGSKTRPAYNEANLLDKVEVLLPGADQWTPYVRNLEYNARGQRVLIELGCGAKTSYAYEDDTFRLSTMDTKGADGVALQRLTYTYDPVGNVVVSDDLVQDTVFFANAAVPATRTYQYDPTYRLTGATGREHIGQTSQPGPYDPAPHANDAAAMRAYAEQYQYDACGNILAVMHTAANGNWTRRHSVAADSNRLLANSIPSDDPGMFSARYTHDGNGNVTSMPHMFQMDWDAANRLIHVNSGSDAYYQYDANGQRVRATVTKDGTTETRLYLGQSEVYRKVVAGTLRVERDTLHVMDGVKRVALVETTTVDDGRPVPAPVPVQRYQVSDHLDTARIELDKDAIALSFEEFHPFGTTSFQSARGAALVSTKRYRFTGKEKDLETGLYYHGARYYAPWLGRWTAPDPAGFADGLNLYAYVRNNPVRLADPTGRAGEDEKPKQSTTMPRNSGVAGTFAHERILPELQFRLAIRGVLSHTKLNAPEGSKNVNSDRDGIIDIAVMLGDQAHVYELKPMNPAEYKDYQSEVRSYTEHLTEIDGEPVDAKVGTILGVLERVDPKIFEPIEIDLGEADLYLHFGPAKSNNGMPVPGLLVYTQTLVPKEKKVTDAKTGVVTVAKPAGQQKVENTVQSLQVNLRADAEKQAHGQVRTQFMFGGMMNTALAGGQLALLGGGLALPIAGTGAVTGTAGTTTAGGTGASATILQFPARAAAAAAAAASAAASFLFGPAQPKK